MADTEYSETHFRETLDLTGQRIQNALFRDCTITGLRKALLLDCEFPGCKVAIDNPLDFLDLTLTLNCWAFDDVALSETVFDALVYLISLGSGNDRKRQALRDLVEPQRLRLFERAFPNIGTR